MINYLQFLFAVVVVTQQPVEEGCFQQLQQLVAVGMAAEKVAKMEMGQETHLLLHQSMVGKDLHQL